MKHKLFSKASLPFQDCTALTFQSPVSSVVWLDCTIFSIQSTARHPPIYRPLCPKDEENRGFTPYSEFKTAPLPMPNCQSSNLHNSKVKPDFLD